MVLQSGLVSHADCDREGGVLPLGNGGEWVRLLNLWEDDDGDHSDKQEQEDYNAIDVDGLGEDQLDDSDEDEAIWNIKQLHKT